MYFKVHRYFNSYHAGIIIHKMAWILPLDICTFLLFGTLSRVTVHKSSVLF